MKTLTIALLPLFVLAVSALSAPADTVTRDEAWTVAENWVTLIINKEGSWAKVDAGSIGVKEVQELMRDGRLLGYLCHVEPKGYVVIAPCRELYPVRSYSDSGDLDPESEEGLAGFIKVEMEGILQEMEKTTGDKLSTQAEGSADTIEGDHHAIWETLSLDPQNFVEALEAGVIMTDYEGGGDPLLTSSWRQGSPYNQDCPGPGVASNCSESPCPVGCTPLAGAQIMRYWAWPPAYDWEKMPDTLDSDDPTQAQIDAVARLCHEIGEKANADYCIPGFGCQTYLSLDSLEEVVKEHFRFNDEADLDWRITEDDEKWFGYFKEQLSKNRPVPYELGTAFHTIVCDGWREVGGVRQLHLNYGWADDNTDWHTIGEQPYLGTGENIIRNLYPGPSLGSGLSGDPPEDNRRYELKSWPYRYFDRNCYGKNVTFDPGQQLQFLAGVGAYATSSEGHYIRFSGTPSKNTRIFSIKGTSTGGLVAGIRIYDGGMRLYQNAGLAFHRGL